MQPNFSFSSLRSLPVRIGRKCQLAQNTGEKDRTGGVGYTSHLSLWSGLQAAGSLHFSPRAYKRVTEGWLSTLGSNNITPFWNWHHVSNQAPYTYLRPEGLPLARLLTCMDHWSFLDVFVCNLQSWPSPSWSTTYMGGPSCFADAVLN